MAAPDADDVPAAGNWVIARLHRAGLRATIARCLVLQTLSGSPPLQLEQIVDVVRQQLDGLNAATIRRAARTLADHRLLDVAPGRDQTALRRAGGVPTGHRH